MLVARRVRHRHEGKRRDDTFARAKIGFDFRLGLGQALPVAAVELRPVDIAAQVIEIGVELQCGLQIGGRKIVTAQIFVSNAAALQRLGVVRRKLERAVGADDSFLIATQVGQRDGAVMKRQRIVRR